jgi:hypothetical protein
MIDRVNVIGRLGSSAPAELSHVPQFSAAISDPVIRSGAQLIESVRDINYPLMVPPGTPDETVEALRTAYRTMTTDPAFITEVESIGEFAFAPTSGADMSKIVEGHLEADAAVLEAARALVK